MLFRSLGSVAVVANNHAIGILTLVIVLLLIQDAAVLDVLVDAIVLHWVIAHEDS